MNEVNSDVLPIETPEIPDLSVKVSGLDMAKVCLQQALVILKSEASIPRPGIRDLVKAVDQLEYVCFLLALVDNNSAGSELAFIKLISDKSINERVMKNS